MTEKGPLCLRIIVMFLDVFRAHPGWREGSLIPRQLLDKKEHGRAMRGKTPIQDTCIGSFGAGHVDDNGRALRDIMLTTSVASMSLQ